MGLFDNAMNFISNAFSNFRNNFNNNFNSNFPNYSQPSSQNYSDNSNYNQNEANNFNGVSNLVNYILPRINNQQDIYNSNSNWDYLIPEGERSPLYNDNASENDLINTSLFESWLKDQKEKPISDQLSLNDISASSVPDAIYLTRNQTDENKIKALSDYNKRTNIEFRNEPSYFDKRDLLTFSHPQYKYYPGYPRISGDYFNDLQQRSNNNSLTEEDRQFINDNYTNILLSNYLYNGLNYGKGYSYDKNVYDEEKSKYKQRKKSKKE